MMMEKESILEMIGQSDMVLVGLGEDFDNLWELQKSEKYSDGCKVLKEEKIYWLLPAWNEFCIGKSKATQWGRLSKRPRSFWRIKTIL